MLFLRPPSTTNFIFASSFFCLGAKNFWWIVHSDGYKKIMWVHISCWQAPVETFGCSYQLCISRITEGKTPEEIRETFHLPDDLTEVCCQLKVCLHSLACVGVFSFRFGFLQEEKLEPLRNITDDQRIRLLNRLHARKQRE